MDPNRAAADVSPHGTEHCIFLPNASDSQEKIEELVDHFIARVEGGGLPVARTCLGPQGPRTVVTLYSKRVENLQFCGNCLGNRGRIHEQGVSLDSSSVRGANWQKYHDGVTWEKGPASYFLVLGESRKTARNGRSHAAETTKCSPGERVRNMEPRRTLVLLFATPPEIVGPPGKPHGTARTLPWTSAARVRACRAHECHRIFGSVFGLRSIHDHYFRFTIFGTIHEKL